MFTIKLIICFILISHIIAQNENGLSRSHEDHDLIIEPPQLALQSTDAEGIFYCNGRVELKKQQRKLMASIDKPIPAAPKFLLKTQQMNSTAIRIRIIPNGFIGLNRIICHWSDNLTNGQPADLTIEAKPGVIQLKKPCLAYDRRYVECIFDAPIVARAFRNGFPQLYSFSELNLGSISYRPSPVLVNITNDNELVFHFEPEERNIIPKKILMSVNITISRFEPTVYRFYIEPMHTTKVDFRIDNISSKQFIIRIDHNNTGPMSQRLCSGHISEVNNQNISKGYQDIQETSDHKISIDRLYPSTQYEVCLRCFYEKTDQSYKDDKCVRIETTKREWSVWFIAAVIVLGGVVLALVSIVVFRLIRRSSGTKLPSKYNSITTKSSDSEIIDRKENSSTTHLPPLRYAPEPGEREVLLFPENNVSTVYEVTSLSDGQAYRSLNNLMEVLTDKNKISPDTYDLPRSQKI